MQTALGANSSTNDRTHDYLNQIDSSQTSGQTTINPIYDPAGNLSYDGEFVYQHDAWNRLCQVNLPQANAPPGTPGLVVKHYLYDGLGRLVRVQSPYPDPQTGATNDEVRSERIFYDGVRRIQELVTDPLPDTSFAAQQGNQEAQATVTGQPTANQNTASSRTENSLLGGGPGGGTGLPPGLSLEREYIWGPGDRGLDELIAQYGPTRNVSYPLHDGGGDIIALVDKGGAGGATRLLWQATYDAYGQIIDQEAPVAAHTYLHAGHRGLFFDRLDSSIVDPVSFNEIPRLMPAGHAGSTGTARIIGYARNRHLHTGFGRWLQRDPNATGLGVLQFGAMHGIALTPTPHVFAIHSHYADGVNVFEAARSASYENSDPLGLFIQSPFDTMMMGQELMELLRDAFSEYAEAQEEMFDWALDWSLQDDEYDGSNYVDLDEEMESHGLMGGVFSGLKHIAKKGAKKLSLSDRSAFRKQARNMFKRALEDIGRSLGKNFEIHHRIPLRFAHIVKVNPNQVRNLQKVAKGTHRLITEAWDQFARKHRNPPPTVDQIRAFANKIDRDFLMPSKTLKTLYDKLIERAREIETPSRTRRRGGATDSQINACEQRAGIQFPTELRAWLRVCDGIVMQNGCQLYGTTDDVEDSSINVYIHENPTYFDWKLHVPIGGDISGHEYALCLQPTKAGLYPVVGRNFMGREGGEHFVIASSLPDFLARFIVAAETMDEFWPQIRKSRAYEDDPDLAKITEWPGPWTSRYKFVEPEPGSRQEQFWNKVADRARQLARKRKKKKTTVAKKTTRAATKKPPRKR